MLKNIAEALPHLPPLLIPLVALLGVVILGLSARSLLQMRRQRTIAGTPMSYSRVGLLTFTHAIGVIFLVLCAPEALTPEFYTSPTTPTLMAGIAWLILGVVFLGGALYLFAIETEDDKDATIVFGVWTSLCLACAVGTVGMGLFRFNQYVGLIR